MTTRPDLPTPPTTLILSLLVAALTLLLSTAAVAAPPVSVTVVEDDTDHTVLRYDVHHYALTPVTVGGAQHVTVTLGKESPLKIAGAPELPTVNRSIIIGDDAFVEAQLVAGSYHEVPNVDIAPSKGILYRSVAPSSVPYSFGPSYSVDALYPTQVAIVGEPYILRDHRGVVVTFHPFQYNPVTRVLRVYDSATIEVAKVGMDTLNVLSVAPQGGSLAFHEIADHHFLNFGAKDRYEPLTEEGDMLIVAHDEWLDNVLPLVEHRNLVGIDTTAVGVSTIGNDVAAIQAHIQAEYDGGNLVFVLLVGDAAQVATPQGSGGSSDPSYAKLAGDDDYADVLIGRLSAETPEQVDTQVQRLIDYELQQATQQPWFTKGMGIASTEGPGDDGEMDNEHIDNIRNDLLAGGYSHVDQFYGNVSATDVGDAFNEGRGIVNYCGHGSAGSFATSGFNKSHVQALNNTGKLPFIVSVACLNGQFASGTCLGESFLRANSDGAPTGAIGMYASSILQSWSPPMSAQDEVTDLFLAEAYHSLGALLFAGSAKMIDDYGSAGVEMYDTWHLFGDPALRVVGIVPLPGLQVTPNDDFVSAGEEGGPFDVTEQSYTLKNGSDYAIDFSVSWQRPWITVSPASGALAPGETATVTVSLNDGADALSVGVWHDTIAIVNETDHDGDTDRQLTLTIGEPEAQHSWPLDEDPGWTTEGQWAFGVPTGDGGGEFGSPDATSGNTGDNVYGYNLEGDYSNELGPEHLTTTAIDCSQLANLQLKFWRWLNVEKASCDQAQVHISSDGENWTTIWENNEDLSDTEWTEVELDISEHADGNSEVLIRWTMGPTDAGRTASGWNIDDIELWGMPATCTDPDGDGYQPPVCGGDDCDDDDGARNPGADEICDDGVDNDCDGDVDMDDAACDDGAGGGGPAPPASGDEDDGCGCRLVSSPATGEWGWLLAGLVGALVWCRRRTKHCA